MDITLKQITTLYTRWGEISNGSSNHVRLEMSVNVYLKIKKFLTLITSIQNVVGKIHTLQLNLARMRFSVTLVYVQVYCSLLFN